MSVQLNKINVIRIVTTTLDLFHALAIPALCSVVMD